MEKNARTTKKQRELLAFIDAFIKGNNYAPSYREIMRAVGYKSVSTVAIHIDGLIAKGYLRKLDNSARSIEVVRTTQQPASNDHHDWLVAELRRKIAAGATDAERAGFELTLDALAIPRQRLNDTE
jgi:SOS-response transcriptional repressor LexA